MPVAENVTSKIPSKWLDASLLKGKPRQFIVADVNQEEFKSFKGGAPEKKLVLTLTTGTGEELHQRLILNPTRQKQMNRFYGDKPAKWTGKQVILSPAESSFGGQTIDIAMPVQASNEDGDQGDEFERAGF